MEQVIPCAEPHCRRCGEETAVIGYDESEQLDVEPARYFVRVTKREKRACGEVRDGGDGGRWRRASWKKGLASDRGGDSNGGREVLRSSSVVPASGDAGTRSGRGDQPRHTGWLGDAGGRVTAAGGRQRCGGICSRASYLQADETTVPVQMHDKRGGESSGYLWQYGKPGGETVFDFCLGRGREGPRKFLGQWEGILQTDGYQAYDDIGGPKLVHVGCWAHARRKFVDAVKVNPQDARGDRRWSRAWTRCFWWIAKRASEQLSVGGASGAAPRACRIVGRRDSRECAGLSRDGAAEKRAGPSGDLHLKYVAEAAALFRLRRSRAVQQPGGELDAPGRAWAARTGCTWAARSPARRSRRFSRWWNPAAGLACPVKDYLLAVLPGMARRNVSDLAHLTPARWAASRD